MRKVALGATLLAGLAFTGSAQARHHRHHRPDYCAMLARLPVDPSAQTITVINQANVRPENLCRVERAVQDQALQLRAAWGTPPIRFGVGGWRVYLRNGGFFTDGTHSNYGQQPYAVVWTGGVNYEFWSYAFSHEIVETLADPVSRIYYYGTTGYQLEIADPVGSHTYRIAGVNVSDFVLPNWFAGATNGNNITCMGQICGDLGSPLIAPANNAGPWDEMATLPGPWQTDSGNHSYRSIN